MDNALTHLFDIGLIKKMGDGKFAAVGSYEEHQQLMGQKHEDGKISKQIEKMMKLQPAFVPSEERARATQQLELDETFPKWNTKSKYGH